MTTLSNENVTKTAEFNIVDINRLASIQDCKESCQHGMAADKD